MIRRASKSYTPQTIKLMFKVVFLGEGRVGKTSIGKRWAEDTFDSATRSTVAAGCFEKTVTSKDGKMLKIVLMDTAGQEEYHSLAPIYYKDAHAALLVFSIIDEAGFHRMQQWKNELIASRGPDIKIIVVGNKLDLAKNRVIQQDAANQFAQSIKSQYFEVSAKTGQGIDLLFAHLAEILAKLPQPESGAGQKRASRVGIQIVNGDEEPQRNGCC
jgi:small GTP-binding protein